MTFKHASVSVGVSPTSLLTGVDDRQVDKRRSILVHNSSGVSVSVGGSDVVSGQGYELKAGMDLALDLEKGDVPYACVSTGTASVVVLHMGV